MTWLVVGLGNPGSRYENTRHNIGHRVASELADGMGERFRRGRRRSQLAETAEGVVGGERAVVACSRGYMNESGGPVKALLAHFDVPIERLVVIHDELDLDLGSLRVKSGGGDNGHNGLKSIRQVLRTGDFFRIRCGIGRPYRGQRIEDFVLTPFAKAERDEVPLMTVAAADAVESLLEKGLKSTQNEFNK